MWECRQDGHRLLDESRQVLHAVGATTVDPALDAELRLETLGTAGITGVSVYARAPLTLLESVYNCPILGVPDSPRNLQAVPIEKKRRAHRGHKTWKNFPLGVLTGHRERSYKAFSIRDAVRRKLRSGRLRRPLPTSASE